MATAKTLTSKNPPATNRRAGNSRGRLSRRWLQGLLVLAVAAAVLVWFYREPLFGYSRAGVAYGARVGCACRYIDGRELASCKGDMEDGMGLVFLSENPEARTVTARVPLVASVTAEHRKGWGCVLEKWDH